MLIGFLAQMDKNMPRIITGTIIGWILWQAINKSKQKKEGEREGLNQSKTFPYILCGVFTERNAIECKELNDGVASTVRELECHTAALRLVSVCLSKRRLCDWGPRGLRRKLEFGGLTVDPWRSGCSSLCDWQMKAYWPFNLAEPCREGISICVQHLGSAKFKLQRTDLYRILSHLFSFLTSKIHFSIMWTNVNPVWSM